MYQTQPALVGSIESLFQRLADLLLKISDKNYTKPLQLLSGATVGKQVRHCLEVAETLVSGFGSDLISYDQRARNPIYENSPKATAERILELAKEFNRIDWEGDIKVSYLVDPNSGIENILDSSWERELLYVQEHTIHHEAIIRVALEHMGFEDIPESFGFAISTLQYNSSRPLLAWDPVI
ncbi:hypothetical protein [Leptospira sarikeiensis]|uniref:DinB family protein n=1 Tax=Leptospira sarikeiensis TaxID=2484943 RepID=A0A4V6QM99_9LEPT|nr:hypothetical protein [Leptospira sarikeiensis]TGL64300.1 hypothetical protein EHQ64_02935 [Leptospira sarikeiensis]